MQLAPEMGLVLVLPDNIPFTCGLSKLCTRVCNHVELSIGWPAACAALGLSEEDGIGLRKLPPDSADGKQSTEAVALSEFWSAINLASFSSALAVLQSSHITRRPCCTLTHANADTVYSQKQHTSKHFSPSAQESFRN